MKPLPLILLCALSFLAGFHMQKPIAAEVRYQSVYIPVTMPPLRETKYAHEQINRIAATVPASALREAKK